MAADLARIVIVNVLFLFVGIGLGALVGLFDARRLTWPRAAAAYMLGLAVVGILSTYLALLGVALGWIGLLLLALALVAAGGFRLVRSAGPSDPQPATAWSLPHRLGGLLLVGASLVLLVYAARTFAVRPLVEWDGWAQWALKARVLYELPDDAATVLRDADYGHPTYPLVVPSLEAIAFRAMGHFDGGLADLQLLALALGFVGAVWALLRDVCSPFLVGLSLLAVLTAPQFLHQLSWNYADVPLALFVAAGLVACGRWLLGDPGDRWPLACAVAFLVAAGLTKNEGLLFAGAAAVSLAAVSLRDPLRRRPALAAAGLVALVMLPWRAYAAAYRIPSSDYDLADAFDPGYLADQASRVGPVLDELWFQLTQVESWGLLLPVSAAALVGAFASRRFIVGAFAALWGALAFGGLLVTYWISTLPLTDNLASSSYRTVISLLVGAVSLVPVLLVDAPATVRAAFEDVRRSVSRVA